jgi:hypothetical protein
MPPGKVLRGQLFWFLDLNFHNHEEFYVSFFTLFILWHLSSSELSVTCHLNDWWCSSYWQNYVLFQANTHFQARPLKTKELSDPQLSVLIAEKMASIHQMNIPINKEPRWLWDTVNGYVTCQVQLLGDRKIRTLQDWIKWESVVIDSDLTIPLYLISSIITIHVRNFKSSKFDCVSLWFGWEK